MLTRTDCLMLLAELEDNGVDTVEMSRAVIKSAAIDTDVLKFINQHKTFDVLNFYRHLRSSYNNKKSKLYINIVQIEEREPKDILVTLSSLLTQILLHSNKCSNRQLFLKHARADEVSKVLNNYFTTFDLTPCIQLLKLVRADLKAFESLK